MSITDKASVDDFSDERKLYFENFESLCERCYLNDDLFAKVVLFALEDGTPDENQNVTLELPELPYTPKAIEDELLSIGIKDFKFIHPSYWPQYVEIKNKKRRDFHREIERRQLETFNHLVEKYANDPSLSLAATRSTIQYTRSEPQPSVNDTLEQPLTQSEYQLPKSQSWSLLPLPSLCDMLDQYLLMYQKNFSTNPFIKGLHHALKSQINTQTNIKWCFSDAALTQVGDDFVYDSIRLLFSLDFVGQTQKKDALGNFPIIDREWTSGGRLSDTDLKELLSHFDGLDKLRGRETGSLTTIATTRPSCRQKFGIHDRGDPGASPEGRRNFRLAHLITCCGFNMTSSREI